MPDFSFEQAAGQRGYGMVAGVDEAGRGPLAGPVCAAAVILPETIDLPGLNDSKKVSPRVRERLYDAIISQAVSYSVAYAGVEEIESLNILNATFLAMQRAVEGLSVQPQYVLVDGNRLPPDLNMPAQALIKGDARSYSVAAASILAKVTRDRLLLQYDQEYPVYGFASHKGYGTKAHIEAIRQYGPCAIHRMSFLSHFL